MVSPFVATRTPAGAVDGRISFQVDSLPELDPVERMLLATDGTLSDALESVFLEEIIVQRIQLGLYPQTMARNFLRARDDEEVHEREVLLRGKSSRNNYVYAKSVVAVERLPMAMRRDLEETNIGIGRLWRRERIEIFKEFVARGLCSAPRLSHCLGLGRQNKVLARTYIAHSAGVPVAVISELMPRMSHGRERSPSMGSFSAEAPLAS